MSWTKLDDGFHGHPKVLETSLEAVGLHALALSYCARYLTDGTLSRTAVTMLGRGDSALALAHELVASGLWEIEGEGFVIHDYLEYNLSSKDAVSLRKAAKQRMQQFRKRSRERTPNKRRTNTFVPDGTGRDLSSSAASPEGESERKPKGKPSADEQARGLLELVNETGGTHFEPVESNLRLIRGRLAEFGDWTLAAMVMRQWATWKAKPEMRPYFRPATLFNAEKCAQYVGQLTDVDRAWIARKQAEVAA